MVKLPICRCAMPGIYAVYADTTHTNKENPDEASHRSILAQEKIAWRRYAAWCRAYLAWLHDTCLRSLYFRTSCVKSRGESCSGLFCLLSSEVEQLMCSLLSLITDAKRNVLRIRPDGPEILVTTLGKKTYSSYVCFPLVSCDAINPDTCLRVAINDQSHRAAQSCTI
jgi:hypothetical protein